MSENKKPAAVLALSAAGVAGLMLAWLLLPVEEWLRSFSDWADGLGWTGVVLMTAGYAIGTILLVPGFPMTLALAFAYGWWAGVISFSAGLFAALVAFLIARYAARDRVERYMKKRPALKAFDEAAADETFKTVLLSRLSPVTPFAVTNYLFGVTGVKLVPFMLASALGVVPGTILNVWLGVLGRTASRGDASLATWASLVAGLIATVVLCVWIGRQAKARMKTAGAR